MSNDKDYIVKLGFDLSELEQVNKKVRKKIQRETDALQEQQVKKQVKTDKARLEREAYIVERQQRNLQRAIRRAEKKGVGGLSGIKYSAESKNKIRLGQAELDLKDKVLKHDMDRTDALSAQARQAKSLSTLDKENYRIWQLKQEGENKRQNQANKEKAFQREQERLKITAEQNLLDKENYRIWQLKQQGEQRRARQMEAAHAEAIRMNRTMNPKRPNASWRLEDNISFTQSRAANANVTGPRLGALQSQMSSLESLKMAAATAKTTREAENLNRQYREIKKNIDRIIRSQEAYNRSMKRGSAIGSKFVGSLKSASLQIASVYAIGSVAASTFRIGVEMDSMQASLLAASDGAKGAAENFKFLKETGRTLGKDIQTLTGGFNRIGAAAKAVGFNVDETREIFLAATEASTAYGLDAQRTGLVMLAFSQMMSYHNGSFT